MHQFLSIALFTFLSASYLSVAHADSMNSSLDEDLLNSIRQQSNVLKMGLLQDDLDKTLSVYAEDAIVLPEYQPALNGKAKIRSYYASMQNKRDLQSLAFTSGETFQIQDLIFEFGTFTTQIKWHHTQETEEQTLEGKYWRVWELASEGNIALTYEIFGFYERLNNAAWWVTDIETREDSAPNGFKTSDASVELKAYRALGEKGVKHKNGELRSTLYAEDAITYPYAGAPKIGIEVIRPYLLAYSDHDAYVDSVQTTSHYVRYMNDYIFEISKFSVSWYYAGIPDSAAGKGMRIWKRMDNGELRIFRHFGSHNYK